MIPNTTSPDTPSVRRQVSFASGSPPITIQDRLTTSSTSSDDQTAVAFPDAASIHRKGSLASQTSEFEPPIIPYARSYQPIREGRASPSFSAGRYRFPTPAR
jgi:hypothetical protein